MKLDELNAEAQAWVESILKSHKLNEAGKVLLVEAARERATIAAAEEALRREGYLVEGRYGSKAHAAVAVAKNARAQLLRILIALNLEEEANAEEDEL